MNDLQKMVNKQEMLVNKLRYVLGRVEIATMLSHEAMVWANNSGKVEWCNNAFQDLIDTPREKILGNSLMDLLPLKRSGQQLDERNYPIFTALRANRPRVGNYVFDDGENDIQLEIARAPTNAYGEAPHAVLVIRRFVPEGLGQLSAESLDADVAARMQELLTENKRLTEENQEMRHQLSGIEEKTSDRFEAGYRAKDAFIANMTHEFRTPLSAIMGYADLLRSDVLKSGHEDWAADLEEIKKASNQLFFMVNQLLDLAAIEEDLANLNMTPFSLPNFLEEIEAVAHAYMVEQENTFRLEIHDSIDIFETDESKLRKVLLNLLNNAAKFTVKGEVELHIMTVREDTDEFVLFAVQDSGIGMTEEQLDNIFDAFTQVDESMTRQYEGTGLGLYICDRFCRLMGGSITAVSTPGKGATFTVRLPLAYQSED